MAHCCRWATDETDEASTLALGGDVGRLWKTGMMTTGADWDHDEIESVQGDILGMK